MKCLTLLFCLIVLLDTCEAQTARNFRTSTFSALGSPNESNVRWCSDCQATAPCTGGGTGAYAYADGSAWTCSLHTGGGGGAGSVTSVAANNSVSGLTMTISNPTTTPTINLSGTPNIAGTNITSGTVPTARLGSGTANNTTFLRGDQTWASGIGTVTSVGLTGPAEFSFGAAVTTSGNLTFSKANQNANLVYAGPSLGGAAQPGFRSLVAGDIPSIAEVKFLFSDITTANSTTVMHGLLPKLSGSGSDCLRGDGSWLACGGGGGGGDFSTNTTTSVLDQVVVASGTGGKTGQFATGTGVGILTAGVLSFKTNPSGAFVGDTDTQTLSAKTFLLPIIASFANAIHNHTNSAGGGQLTLSAFSSTTGSGAVPGQVSPQFVTPNIGAATATSVNGLLITTTTGRVTIANGKTFTANNSVALSGTDGTTMTFPSGSGSVLTADSTATVSNKTFTLPILGANAGLPATCTVGQDVRNSNDSKRYFCYATNTWGEVLVAGASGIVSTTNGGTGAASPSGTVTISGATSGSTTFPVAYSNAPNCVVTPRSDVGSGVRFWATTTASAITVQTSSSVSVTFTFVCMGNPN